MISFDPKHGFTVARAARVPFYETYNVCISNVGPDNELHGGVIVSNYSQNGSVCLHMAGFRPNWANKEFIWVLFDYVFNQLKVKKVFAQVPSGNARALEINSRLGFKQEARIADVFEGEDLIVMAMKRDDCRWLRLRKPKWA